MNAVIDFLIEYYTWFLVVIAILLITVVGFLVDTKRKKKLRKNAMANESTSESTDINMMGNLNDINSINNGMDMNNINGINAPIGDTTNNMFNQNMNNNLNNQNNILGNVPPVMNEMNSGVNNSNFFNTTPEQQQVFTPKPVEATPIMNTNVNNQMNNGINNVVTPTPVVEPTAAVQNPIPEVNVQVPNEQNIPNQNMGQPMYNQGNIPNMNINNGPVLNEVPNSLNTIPSTPIMTQEHDIPINTANNIPSVNTPINQTPVMEEPVTSPVSPVIGNQVNPSVNNIPAQPFNQNVTPNTNTMNVNNNIPNIPNFGPNINNGIPNQVNNQNIPFQNDNWKL